MAQRKYNSGMEPAVFSLKISEDLRELIGAAAGEAGQTMNEYIAKVMADHFGKPALAKIPRKPMGRPRKELSSRAS